MTTIAFFLAVFLTTPSVKAVYQKSFGIIPSIYTSWSGPSEPIQNTTGFEVAPTMSEVWYSKRFVNWTKIKNLINKAKPLSGGVWSQQPVALTIPPLNLDVGGTGTKEDPYNQTWAPDWAKPYLITINAKADNSGKFYQVWDYAALTEDAVWFVTEAGKTANLDADTMHKVGVIRLYLGFQGETQPVKGRDGDSDILSRVAANGSSYCNSYKDYIFEVGKAAALAFPTKPVIAMAEPTGCAQGALSWTQSLFTRWLNDPQMKAAGVMVGFSSNSFREDWSGSEGFLPNTDWYGWNVYKNLKNKAGLSTETYILSKDKGWSADAINVHSYYGSLAAQSLGATSWFSPKAVLGDLWPIFFEDWRSYATNNRASVILRDREMAGASWDNSNGSSGFRGNFNIGATQTNVVLTPQACGGAWEEAKAYLDSITSKYKDPTCLVKMPNNFSSSDNYATLYNRQARFTLPDGKFEFSTTVPWAENASRLRLILASPIGGNIVVTTSGGQTKTISLTANQWLVDTIPLTAKAKNVTITNNTSGNLFMHRIDWLRDTGQAGDGGGAGAADAGNCEGKSRFDINCDGKVNLLDLNILNSKIK